MQFMRRVCTDVKRNVAMNLPVFISISTSRSHVRPLTYKFEWGRHETTVPPDSPILNTLKFSPNHLFSPSPLLCLCKTLQSLKPLISNPYKGSTAMHCSVRLTQASQPKWLAKALSMHPTSSIGALESKLVNIFSSSISELILAQPIPLPALIYGQNSQLPTIKGIITHIDFQKDAARIVLHDSTKKALSLAYTHFLCTWPMRYVKSPMKHAFHKKFMDMTNAVHWELRCENIQDAFPDGYWDFLKYHKHFLPQEHEEMLGNFVRGVKSLFFVGISTEIPWTTIWDIPFLVPQDEIKEYSPNEICSNPTEEPERENQGGNGQINIFENSGQRNAQQTLFSSTPSHDTIMATQNTNKLPISPILASRKKAKILRSANVSQNSRGGKIRIPSISHESSSRYRMQKASNQLQVGNSEILDQFHQTSN